MAKKLLKRPKKVVRQHGNYVIYVTPEAKRLKWTDNTVIKVTVSGKKLIVEKIAEL